MEDPRPQSSPAQPSAQQAWDMILGQLASGMSSALFGTYLRPLEPLDYSAGVFTLGASNRLNSQKVAEEFGPRIASLLRGVYGQTVHVRVAVMNSDYPPALARVPAPADPQPAVPQPGESRPAAEPPADTQPPSPRKMMLQRAYGTQRARVVQPERGMFITMYFFNQWIPRLGHSAAMVIMAARSLCFWDIRTGEKRNTINTEIGDLALRASLSVRRVKDVLHEPLVRQYFLRYTVRRTMTSNGIRTAGITLCVRMDDPLTPEDQESSGQYEEDDWYPAEFSDDRD